MTAWNYKSPATRHRLRRIAAAAGVAILVAAPIGLTAIGFARPAVAQSNDHHPPEGHPPEGHAPAGHPPEAHRPEAHPSPDAHRRDEDARARAERERREREAREHHPPPYHPPAYVNVAPPIYYAPSTPSINLDFILPLN